MQNVIISPSILLRMVNVVGKVVIKMKNILYSTNFISENRAGYEVRQVYMVEPDKPHMTIWHMRSACWIPKATNTHSQCVISIAFPRYWWLGVRTSMFLYTYVACLVCLVLEIKRFCAFGAKSGKEMKEWKNYIQGSFIICAIYCEC